MELAIKTMVSPVYTHEEVIEKIHSGKIKGISKTNEVKTKDGLAVINSAPFYLLPKDFQPDRVYDINAMKRWFV